MVRLVIINGKGGVGKTTASSAMAIWFASKGFNTMLLSTDPAASVGDCLNQPIGFETVPVQGFANFWAMEINGFHEYEKLLKYIKRTSPDFDVERFLPQKGTPGLSELAALFRAVTYLYNLKYDIIVVDTAPTGHTLEMLRTPEMMKDTLGSLKSVMKVNTLKNMITRQTTKNTINDRLDALMNCADQIASVMANQDTTHFNIVCTAEFMALRESIRAYNDFARYGVFARNIILNRIQPNNAGCHFCSEKRTQHEFYVDKMEKEFKNKDVGIAKVQDYAHEAAGSDVLNEIGRTIMHQLDNLNVKRAYSVASRNGGFVVKTELPFIEPGNLGFRVDGKILYMTISYGLHEDVINVLSFPRVIQGVQAVDDDGKLMLKVM